MTVPVFTVPINRRAATEREGRCIPGLERPGYPHTAASRHADTSPCDIAMVAREFVPRQPLAGG